MNVTIILFRALLNNGPCEKNYFKECLILFLSIVLQQHVFDYCTFLILFNFAASYSMFKIRRNFGKPFQRVNGV